MKKSLLVTCAIASTWLAQPASSITIGYFDTSRELWGFDGGGGYLSNAKQSLIDAGHTLVATSSADAAFLSSVDAFYTGLISSISDAEIQAMEDFVNVDGGFLFIQQDHDSGSWHGPSQQILANWGIASSSGTFGNDFGHTTVGTSDWVTDPNAVTGLSGAAHSAIGTIPVGFETLAVDDLGRVILGVFDAGAGRSSDVLVATDINFWDNSIGWNDERNRNLWQNIWTAASGQIEEPPTTTVPDGGATLGLMMLGLASVAASARATKRRR